MTKPAACPPGFVHVDLDGLWTLAGCYGYDEADQFENDPVFSLALDRLLALFDSLEMRATFFINGRDLDHPEKSRRIGAIAQRGHELANHGWSHRIGLEQLPDEELRGEIERTGDRLTALTGRRPLGFRAPGYDAGPRVLTACSAAGIRYDGSTLPTFWGPGLRWLAGRLRKKVRRETHATPPDRHAAAGQYGRGGSLDTAWFRPTGGGSPVIRLPLAVSPVLRVPVHASMGMMMGSGRVKGALAGLTDRGYPVTYLLHGLDLLGADEFVGRLPLALSSNRGFQLGLGDKMKFLDDVLNALKTMTTMGLSGDWIERQPTPAP